jgi:DNA-binding LacI/PurR family transcriptional regulator
MLGSITRACARQGYDLLVSFQQLSEDWHSDFHDSHKADGLILLGYGDYLVARSKLRKLEEQGTHFVRWGAVVEGQPGLSVGCDNLQGGRAITEHLLALGRRQIGFIGNITDRFPEFQDRYDGHCEALNAARVARVPELQVDAVDSTEQVGYRAMQELLQRGLPLDAVFAASDMLAIGALHALADARISVPEQLSVVGFDDLPIAGFASPALTTVLQDTKLAGEILVDRLLKQIRGEPAESAMLPAQVVIRRSCGARVLP